MHIPDGYLSPKTWVLFYAGMLPLWYIASRRVERAMRFKDLPLLSLGAAFTFVIMMFNIPVPGGSSGHMVGSTVVSIALGPWAACMALSLALALQALFFGDGGLTALGANAFNMAFVMSFAGYYVYRFLTLGDAGGARRFIASATAGYISVNAAALAVAIELGIQPLIAHDAAGSPLYAPYPVSVTVPAMMATHLLFFGPVEAIGTSLAVSYIRKMNSSVIRDEAGARAPGLRTLWVVIAVLIILTPLGLLATGTPWGEWGRDEIRSLLGELPKGMEGAIEAWKGIMPDYGIPGMEGRVGSSLAYVIAAAAGSAVIVFIIYLWGRLWPRG